MEDENSERKIKREVKMRSELKSVFTRGSEKEILFISVTKGCD